MKFILIATGFEIGGVTSSMKNLCNELVKRGHDVDILNLPKVKELPKDFDKQINLIDIHGFVKYWNLSIDDLKKSKGIVKLKILLLGIIKKITNKNMLWNIIVFKRLKLNKHYDVSIGFRQSPTSYWLAKYKCNSDLALGFWHTDADFENIQQLEECLNYPDKICCVSNVITNQMRNRYPTIKDKFNTVYNLFDAETIKKLSNNEVIEYDSKFNIITVGRITDSKNMLIIPIICKKLKELELDFCWRIVGDGAERNNIETLIEEFNLQDNLKLLGSMNNPYPYIKNADLFVLTSKWESYGMVVSESLILGTPVVAGDYPALHEILDDGINGIIAENDIDGITNAIIKVCKNKELMNRLKNNAMNYKYSSDKAINQLLSLRDTKNA